MSTLQQEQVPETVADRAAMVCSARDRSDVRNLCAALRRQPALVAALASGALPPDRFALFEAEELATSEQRAQRARPGGGHPRGNRCGRGLLPRSVRVRPGGPGAPDQHRVQLRRRGRLVAPVARPDELSVRLQLLRPNVGLGWRDGTRRKVWVISASVRLLEPVDIDSSLFSMTDILCDSDTKSRTHANNLRW